MVRRVEMAEASLAARREARRVGMAMAAMMPIIATTISSSISEKPFWPFFCCIAFTVLLQEIWLSEDYYSRCRPSSQATRRSRATSVNLARSEEHTSELQSPCNLVCRLLLEKKKNKN